MDCLGGMSILCFVVGLTEIRSALRLASNEPNPCSATVLLSSNSFFNASDNPLNSVSDVSASICSRLLISAIISFVFTIQNVKVEYSARYYEKKLKYANGKGFKR